MAENDRRTEHHDDAAPVDATKVRAKVMNGILDIRVPVPEKRTERRTVRIET